MSESTQGQDTAPAEPAAAPQPDYEGAPPGAPAGPAPALPDYGFDDQPVVKGANPDTEKRDD